MTKPTRLFFDTCFFIDWFQGKIEAPPDLTPAGPVLIVGNALVLMELYQGARSAGEAEEIGRIEKSHDLIAPSLQNYLDAGPILKRMTESGWLSSKRLYETQNDVLLALSAVENKSYIVTRNKKDFERIKRFCPAEVLYY